MPLPSGEYFYKMKGKFKDIKGVTIPPSILERYYLYRSREQLGELIGGVLSGLGIIDPISIPNGEVGTDIENALNTALGCAETYFKRKSSAEKMNECRRNKTAESKNENNKEVELFGVKCKK